MVTFRKYEITQFILAFILLSKQMNGHAYIGNALRQDNGSSWFELRLTADQLALTRVRGTHTKVGENCLHCESLIHFTPCVCRIRDQRKSCIVFRNRVDIIGELCWFRVRNPGRWTVSLEIPMQPSPVARTTTGATSDEERRRRGGGEGGKRNARCCYGNLFSYKITILQTIYIF